MGSVVFSDYHTTGGLANATYDVRINYSESYTSSTRKTKVSLTSVEIRKQGNTTNWPESPVYGDVTIGGTTVLSMDGGSAYVCHISGDGYYTVSNSSGTDTVEITHDAATGKASVNIGVVAGIAGYFAMHYSDYDPTKPGTVHLYAGVPSDDTDVNLTTRAATLTVNPNGGTWSSSTSKQTFTQATGTTKTIANPTRTGYTFKGWTLSGGGSLSGTTYTFGSSNGTLTASWEVTKATLSVNPNGGTWSSSTSTQTFTQNNGTTKTISNPTRTGYTFKGWTLTGGGSLSGTTYTFGSSNGTLKATWEINAYKLTVVPNGGTWNSSTSSQTFTQNYGTTKAIANPTRTGYDFGGWTLSGGGSLSGTTYTYGAKDGSLTAKWAIKTYTLTITSNANATIKVTRNGTTLANGASIAYGDKLAISITPKTGYEIKSKTPTSSSVTVTGNVTVSCVVEPMATIHMRRNGTWVMYLIYRRTNATWQLYQANIRKSGSWQKYF